MNHIGIDTNTQLKFNPSEFHNPTTTQPNPSHNTADNILIHSAIASETLVAFNISYSSAKPQSLNLSGKESHTKSLKPYSRETKGHSITLQVNKILNALKLETSMSNIAYYAIILQGFSTQPTPKP